MLKISYKMSSKAAEPNVPCTSNYDNHMRTIRVSFYTTMYLYLYISISMCVYIPQPSYCMSVLMLIYMYAGPLTVGVIVVFYLA